jgi:hypothetical protein
MDLKNRKETAGRRFSGSSAKLSSRHSRANGNPDNFSTY